MITNWTKKLKLKILIVFQKLKFETKHSQHNKFNKDLIAIYDGI